MLKFEWDNEKAGQNEQKHEVTFEEAATVFGDPLSLTIPDASHSLDEERFVTLGLSSNERLIVVIHLDMGDEAIRLISARPATRKERKSYEQEK